MKTVTKALGLLNLFLDGAGGRSLGALAEGADLDKATARRMLVAMCDHGIVEQDSTSRLYALGPALLPLARAREAARPLVSVVEPAVRRLAQDLGETCHFSVPMHGALTVLAVAEASRPLRVHVREGDVLPLHTSGAGIAYLAASPKSVLDRVLCEPLRTTMPLGYATPKAVLDAVTLARTQGYARTDQIHEEDVSGTAMAVHDGKGALVGVIGVATPLQRMSPQTERDIATALRQTAEQIAPHL